MPDEMVKKRIRLSDNAARTRINVTLTKPYIEGLAQLVEKGIYLNRGNAIMQGIRLLFKMHDIDPFTKKEPPK